MWRRTGVVLAFGALVACTGARAPGGSGASLDEVVEHDSANRETDYTIVSGDCRITWTVYHTEANRGVIRHRSDCGLALAEQAPLIGKVLRKVMAADAEAAAFRTLLGWAAGPRKLMKNWHHGNGGSDEVGWTVKKSRS